MKEAGAVTKDFVVRMAVWGTVLVLAAVVFSRALIRRSRPGELAISIPLPTLAGSGGERGAALELKQRSQEALLAQPWGRDPFSASDTAAPPEIPSEQTKEGDYVLSGILAREGRKVAIINHYFVREGESLDGGEVVRIERDRVLVKRNGEETILRMRPV